MVDGTVAAESLGSGGGGGGDRAGGGLAVYRLPATWAETATAGVVAADLRQLEGPGNEFDAAAWLRDWKDGKALVLVVVRHGRHVGSLVAAVEVAGGCRRLHVGGVYLRPGQQRAAPVLCRVVKHVARQEGCRLIGCMSRRPIDRLWPDLRPVAVWYEAEA